ncbi:hypothetical protein BOTBODRAFT_147767 [Botryobasidium botryosum FD-172 SS1]|uniref:Uncharacterized protein n=1 Tax=Botryobasidium botryosum (strain FD-172 SS1) TaxID=930990 RepID=A0A067M6U3_BOTB1|nr:hypothetical protein BOTBODRAFT_147767 [Botryobasidium botryosum FD-172 SS1]
MDDSDIFSSSPSHPSHIPRRKPADSDAIPSLKRSHSTASTISLPTPPPSRVRRDHNGLKLLISEDSDEDAEYETDDDAPMDTPSGIGATSRAQVISGLQAVRATAARSPSPFTTGGTPPPRLVLELPEEPRTPRPHGATPRARNPCEPVTPVGRSERQRKPTKLAPMRDSPNNPFLSSADSPPRLPRPTAPSGEQPTIAYVFRGVKTVFANPLYSAEPPAAGTVDPSTLPPEHPDFEPSLTVPSKLLFPTAFASSSKSVSSRGIGSEDEYEEDDDLAVDRTPIARKLFAAPTTPVSKKGKEKLVETRSVAPTKAPAAVASKKRDRTGNLKPPSPPKLRIARTPPKSSSTSTVGGKQRLTYQNASVSATTLKPTVSAASGSGPKTLPSDASRPGASKAASSSVSASATASNLGSIPLRRSPRKLTQHQPPHLGPRKRDVRAGGMRAVDVVKLAHGPVRSQQQRKD